MTMDILDLLLVESDRWTAVESHICQNRADMGHRSLAPGQEILASISDAVH
jgi:hypothetical protein